MDGKKQYGRTNETDGMTDGGLDGSKNERTREKTEGRAEGWLKTMQLHWHSEQIK